MGKVRGSPSEADPGLKIGAQWSGAWELLNLIHRGGRLLAQKSHEELSVRCLLAPVSLLVLCKDKRDGREIGSVPRAPHA